MKKANFVLTVQTGNHRIRCLLRRTIALMSIVCAPLLAFAQSQAAFPTKAVTVVTTFSAGSGPDAMMRAVGEKLSSMWKQPVVIDNRPGGAGFLAINATKAAPPDGYTLLMHDGEALSALPYLYKNRNFSTFKTYDAVAVLYSTPFLVAVPSTSKWRTMGELLAEAKQHPEKISYGTWGVGSSIHLQSLLLQNRANVKMLHVPYKEMSQLYTGVSVDDVTWAFGGMASTQFAYKAGKVRYLAVAAPKRIPQLPDVPTFGESDGPAGFEFTAFVALLAPKGTPEAIRAKINSDLISAVADASIKSRYATFNFDASSWSPTEMQRAMEVKASTYEKVIQIERHHLGLERPMSDHQQSQLLPGEIWRWDAIDVAEQIRNGVISSREAVVSCYGRIDEVNPHLNAIVYMDRERALRDADAADSALRAKAKIGAMHGVPITVKLNVDVQGEATSNGVPAFRERVAPADSAVVANLRAAGAIVIGRTNTPPFSFRWFTENPIYGRTLNPWGEHITSGGSSGGAAVAAASGMCALEHGTDIAGSIRYPAYVNGLAGLRPTPGRVPAFHPTTGLRFFGLQALSAQGPLARHVRDLRLGLAAMASADTRDPTWVPAAMNFPDDAAPVRIALVDEIPGAKIASEVRKALLDSARSLEQAGYAVDVVAPPGFADAVEIWQSIVMTESKLGMMQLVRDMDDPIIQKSVQNMDSGPPIDLAGYAKAIARRDELRRTWNEFMTTYPLILMPTSCRTPMPWGADLVESEEMKKLLCDQSPLISVAVLSLPGLSIPTGTADGVPMGVQLVADSFREQRLLIAGAIIEREAHMPNAFSKT